jgi:hypothetical protein
VLMRCYDFAWPDRDLIEKHQRRIDVLMTYEHSFQGAVPGWLYGHIPR